MPRVAFLTDEEIDRFLDELDHNGDGTIDYQEVEAKLDQVHAKIAPNPKPHNLHHDSKDDDDRHHFLRSIIGSDKDRIPRAEFAQRVREWEIPSLKQSKKEEQDEKDYMHDMSVWRRMRSYWAVHGPEILFIALVISMQLAFGIWQMVKYITVVEYRRAFGWGVVLAKTCAGALYPTFFFVILSMSRYFSTFLRKSYYISRFINWDLSQDFHIKISCVALALATLHAIGHLTGSFVFGSQPGRQDAVAYLLGPDAVPRPYRAYAASVPGWTGITALGLFWTLALCSMPPIRRWNYEVFQLSHLLMYPIIGLLMAHGTAALLQWPMLGYWLAFPTLLIFAERVTRISVGFHRIPATVKILDGETVEIKAKVPSERIWKYQAGQYVFLQVPELSFWQWHPFTVSVCIGREFQLHIKTDGDWTGRLRGLANSEGTATPVDIGINGPFGAPAQRFYDFTHTIVVGAGIGITPFSGILADLQARDDQAHGCASSSEEDGGGSGSSGGEKPTLNTSNSGSTLTSPPPAQPPTTHEKTSADTDASPASASASTSAYAPDYRRCDFHWMVRDRNYLLWFSDLLNTVSRSQASRHHSRNTPDADDARHSPRRQEQHLDIRIHTHVTQRRDDIAIHVYRWLLEQHRTPAHPASPLTGLVNATRFGRPDFVGILDAHYDDMRRYQGNLVAVKEREKEKEKQEQGERGERGEEQGVDVDAGRLKVGVFFCGAPVVGEILADRCRALTARGRADGSRVEYHFMMEVFG
ncbi:FAD-binding domain-containing protein [Lasiodiplodia theobromae]|uniref:FAD-binding domain-containing protein n=1 Tax=Lasiodiplodia theobromae TaxID=45133 RepID=UPI0015C367DD|nr:FAD-binding domain-containing protein [Lasiodiplodia theobromae]KAF4546043.1 FAD-binding domain-containing protein [Lasiodiplodia theobromae]